MLNDCSALNTTFRKTPHKQTSFVSPKVKENKLTTFWPREDTWEMWRTLRPTTWSTWVVTIDVSWLLSWSTRPPCWEGIQRTWNDWVCWACAERKEYQYWNDRVRRKIPRNRWHYEKKPPPKKNAVHDTRNNVKDPVERENTAAAEVESTLAEAVAQEIERRSMMRSSTVTDQRDAPAQHDYRRQDGWTSTPRWSDDEEKGSERDTTAGERLQNQRPHPPVKIEDQEGAHEVETGSGCSGGCDLLAGERLPKQRPHDDEHPEHNPKEHLGVRVLHQDDEAFSIKEVRAITSAAAKENEDFLDKDVEILRLIEERRSTPKEEKQRLKDLNKRIKNASEKKKGWRDSKTSKESLKSFKGVRNIPGIKTAKKTVLITKIKNDKGECITSRKGIADVFGEISLQRLYEDNERDDFEHEISEDRRIPEILRQKSYRTQSAN